MRHVFSDTMVLELKLFRRQPSNVTECQRFNRVSVRYQAEHEILKLSRAMIVWHYPDANRDI